MPRPNVHVMLDTETLGVKPGCVVFAIGACEVRKEMSSPQFYSLLSVRDSLRLGLRTEHNTMQWWEEQSAEARLHLEEANTMLAPSVSDVLSRFYDYLLTQLDAELSTLKVWANGAAFDFPILRAVYDAAGYECPWEFRNERCFRTMSAYFAMPKPKPQIAHHALYDAIAQSQVLAATCRSLA